jgi:hypothetical protein
MWHRSGAWNGVAASNSRPPPPSDFCGQYLGLGLRLATTPAYGTSEAGARVGSPINSIALSVARVGGVGILRGELQLPVYFSQKVSRLLRVLVHIVSVVFLRD